MGLSSALLSTLEGQDLCKVCFVIRDENRKQTEPGVVKESSAIAKTLLLASETGEVFPIRPVGTFVGIISIRMQVPLGASGEVPTAPPRFEV